MTDKLKEEAGDRMLHLVKCPKCGKEFEDNKKERKVEVDMTDDEVHQGDKE